jgi:hypothetical protein
MKESSGNRLLTKDEMADSVWKLFTKHCDAEGLNDDERVSALNAISEYFFRANSSGKGSSNE